MISPLHRTPTRPRASAEIPRRITSLGLSSVPAWVSGSRSGVPLISPTGSSSPDSTPPGGLSPARAGTPTPLGKHVGDVEGPAEDADGLCLHPGRREGTGDKRMAPPDTLAAVAMGVLVGAADDVMEALGTGALGHKAQAEAGSGAAGPAEHRPFAPPLHSPSPTVNAVNAAPSNSHSHSTSPHDRDLGPKLSPSRQTSGLSSAPHSVPGPRHSPTIPILPVNMFLETDVPLSAAEQPEPLLPMPRTTVEHLQQPAADTPAATAAEEPAFPGPDDGQADADAMELVHTSPPPSGGASPWQPSSEASPADGLIPFERPVPDEAAPFEEVGLVEEVAVVEEVALVEEVAVVKAPTLVQNPTPVEDPAPPEDPTEEPAPTEKPSPVVFPVKVVPVEDPVSIEESPLALDHMWKAERIDRRARNSLGLDLDGLGVLPVVPTDVYAAPVQSTSPATTSTLSQPAPRVLPEHPRPRPRAASPTTLSPLDPVSPWPPRDIPEADPNGHTNGSAHAHARAAGPGTDLPSAKEVYGSLAVLLTYLAFGTYLFWAVAPPGVLDRIGWTWYPSREWAIIVPCWLMLVVLLTYFSYAALTLFLTPGLDSINLISDEFSAVRPLASAPNPYYWKFADLKAVPEAVDLPLELVNAVLYPRPRKGAGETATAGSGL